MTKAKKSQTTKSQTTETVMPEIEVRIDKMLDGKGVTKAFASANIGGAFAVHGMRVIETDKDRFVAMPQDSYKKDGQTRYTDIFHPVTSESHTALYDAVLKAYEQALDEQMSEAAGQEQEPESEPEPEQEQGMAMSM